MPKQIDLSGERFGRLIVIKDTKKRTAKGSLKIWECKCKCGNIVNVHTGLLRSGRTQSCGCYHNDRVKETFTKHGDSRSYLYKTWVNIRQRCSNPNTREYENYGGRNITVCREWEDYETFRNWALSNGYRRGLSIDRINNSGSYTPANCRWVGAHEQLRNKRNNVLVTYNGKTQIATDWARELNIPSRTLLWRLQQGWNAERALYT